MADLCVVGLGNPGDRYSRTRHNAGVEVVEELVQRWGSGLTKSRTDKALVDTVRIGAKTVLLAVPQTFMNLSGQSVRPLAKRSNVGEDLGRLVIVHDELDIEAGRVKVKFGGGLAGHNGLRSIRDHLKTTDFTRIRVGVGRPPEYMSVSDWVLKRPTPDERHLIDQAVIRAADAVEMLLEHELTTVMGQINGFCAKPLKK